MTMTQTNSPQEPNQYEDKELASAIDDIMLITGKQRGKRMKEAILQLITQKQLEANRAIAQRLQTKIARYGDGEIVYHNREAVVPISAVLAELTKQKGK